jgi:Leucine-rich repeat (LRR) protein
VDNKLFDLVNILLRRGMNFIDPKEGLPARIFQSGHLESTNYILDILLAKRVISFAGFSLNVIPDALVHRLQQLEKAKAEKKVLDLSNNLLLTLPVALANLSIISTVKLDNNPLLLLPASVRRSWPKTQNYLRNIDKRAAKWAQCKVSNTQTQMCKHKEFPFFRREISYLVLLRI